MRRALAGLALAVAAGLFAATLATAQDLNPSSELQRAGWTLVTASEDVFVYMRAARTEAGAPRRAWTAYDSAGPRKRDGFTFRSVESLSEFDCRKRLSRVVEEIYHDGPGLKGQAWKSPSFMVTPWAKPPADSVGALRMAFACHELSDT